MRAQETVSSKAKKLHENVICFGIGQPAMIDQIVIEWPSGDQQVFKNVQADQRLLIVEDEDEPYSLFAAP